MDNVKELLGNLVHVARMNIRMDEASVTNGFNETVYFATWSTIADAIFDIVGEKAMDAFDKSVTMMALRSSMCESDAVQALMTEYEKNHPELPPPHVFSESERQAMRGTGYSVGWWND